LYQEIMAELRSEEPSIREVADIVAKDVGMTAKVLQLVNSAFFGLASEITDTTRAVMQLGTDTVRALALTTGVFSQLDTEASQLESVWGHSTRVALLAQRIAEEEGASKELLDCSYQAGFLHEIGQLVLATILPADHAKALTAARQTGAPLVDKEREVFGATHAELGGYLLGIWGLPDLVVQAVTFHHRPSSFPTHGFSPLAAVHVANVFEREFSATGDSTETVELDHDYLRAVGLDCRLEAWTEVCGELMEEGVAP
jgi:HD-like signal output (HDOD) protein